jgi:hypothetical protein
LGVFSGTSDEGIAYLQQVVAGQANLYIDAQLVVDNTTNQTLGTYFLSQGTIEEVSMSVASLTLLERSLQEHEGWSRIRF